MADGKIGFGGEDIRSYDFGDHKAMATMYPAFASGSNGELISGTVALAGPDVSGKLVQIYAASGNAGIVYVGNNGTSVTVADGTADTTTGVPLGAGDVIGPIPVANLSQLGHVATADDQQIFYITWE